MVIDEQIERLRFPIGPFRAPSDVTPEQLNLMIDTIAAAPIRYRKLTGNLGAEDLMKTYRSGSWNIQQLVNHVADMAMLHFFRMKKAVTETDYKEITLVNMDGWVQTADGSHSPIEDSLDMFEAIVKRHVHLMRSLNQQQLDISYFHPVRKITLNQKQAISMSEWHVKHHFEHITIALNGWQG